MRALVTGVAGFIGSHLAERLLESGASVVGVDGLTDYYDPDRKRANLDSVAGTDEFEFVEGNLRQLDLDELVSGKDVVFHLAGQPGVRRSWGTEFEVYLNENLLTTQRLLEAAKGSQIRRFVFASSSSIYGDAERFPTRESEPPQPVSPYGVSKLAGEHLCQLYHSRFDVPTVSLRYFTVYGPRQRPDMAFARFIAAGLAGERVEVFGDGEQRRDFTFVADAVAATVTAGSEGKPGETYNVAGGSEATVNEVLGLLSGLLGHEIPVEHLSPVTGDARHTGANIDKAAADLGFAPKVGLRQGLSRQLDAARPVSADANRTAKVSSE